MKIKQFIEKAVEGGWTLTGDKPIWDGMYNKFFYSDRDGGYIYLNENDVFLDPKAWEAVGKVEGWGKWSKEFSEIKHDWEVEHYLPDTAKTPVYVCNKCYARKTKNIISIRLPDEEWFTEINEESPDWDKRIVLRGHSFYEEDWKHKMIEMTPNLVNGKSIGEYLETL